MGMVSFKFCNALHLAAYYGHLNVVDLLLSTKRCDPQGTNEHGCTPLHFAANKGHKHIVARLLKVQGIKIDICDVHGRTPLHHGAAQGHAGVVDELWPRGCEIDAADAMGWTALHYAAHAGHTDVVSKLVIAGCPVQKLDNCGYTAGHLAAQGGYADVLERLLHAGYDPDTLGGMTVLHHCGGSTALHMAAAHGHTKVVRQLLCEGSSPSKEDFRGFTALQCAAEGGHLEAFQALLQAGCNPKAHDCCGTTVLHSAASGGNWDIMRNLLDLGCDHSLQTKYGHTALHHAAQGGAQLVARNLLDLGCDIQVTDREGNTPWHAAAEGGNVEVLQLFLDRGCELEARNNAGCTALHCAAKSGSGGAVRALLDKGTDIRAVSSESQTALHYSAEMGHDDIVLLLLETLDKCTVNHQDASGLAVLHHTAEQGNKKMVKALVERGADVNLQTKEGCTPLHLATHGQYQGVVEILLENDCDTSIKDSEGCTALHYAAQRSNLPLFNLLHAGCMTGDKDNQGFSLLHYAVEGGNPDIVGTLLFTGAASYDNMDSSSEVVNALHLACKLGHAVVVSYLLKADYRVDTKGPDGCQPLHYAAQGAPGLWGQKEASHHFHVANLLLDAGADPHAVDDKGCNALMYAAGSGELEMVLKLLLLGVDCTRLDMNQWTSLHWAATSGNVNVVSKLIQAGVPVDTVDNRGRLPLHWSAEQGHLGPVTAILKVMLDKKVDVHQTDNEGATAVQLAARHGHAEVVAKLLESGKTKDVKGLTALHLAAQLRMEDVARLLLGMGKCDVNARDADNCTPLHYSAENGCSSIAGMLLDANADVNVTGADGMMPIHKASSEGHYDVVKLLVDKGALVNFCTSTGSTPLHYAGSAGKGDVLKLLVESGCPVNAMSTGNLSCSALYCAASSGQLEAVDLLLQHGAEVDAICTNDCTALHVAASNGHAQVVKRLLEAGADPDLQAANGAAAIHNAVNNLHLEALEMLLTADCDVDIQNSGGNTALHIAASKGSQELVQEILKAGCDVHIKNAKGWQAVQSAASCGFLEVVLLLVAHGAQFKQKGEMDVSKLLCRKSNLKGSYVDGRLRLAEREKHRKTKPMEQAADTPTGTELKERQAQADAAMAELLAEEQKQRAAEEQLAAKRKAKKDKKKKRKDTAKDNRAKNDHTDGMGGGDSNGAVPEDEDKSTFSALDVETIGSMAKLSLSDPPDTMSVAANEREPEQGKVKGCPGKESGAASVQLKEGVKESDKRLHDRLEEGQNPHPSEGSKKKGKGLENGETVGPSSSQGTVKIIRCHSTATPIISVTKNKKAAVHPAGCAESQKRQTRRASSIASSFQERSQDRGKEPVKIKAQRTRHKTGGPQQNDGHQGTLAANGTVVVVRCQKSSTDAASTQPAWVADSAKSDRMQQCTLTTGGCHPSSKSPLRAGQISGQQRQGTPVATGTTARATPAVLVHNLKPKSGVSTTGKEAGHLEVANQAIGSESTPRGSLPPQPAAAAVPESPSIPQVKSRANPWQRPAKSTTDSAAPALQLPVSCAPAAKAGLLRPHAAMQKAQYAEGAGAAVRASACPQAVQANDQSLMHPATQTNAQLVAQSPTVSSQQARSSVLPVADTAPTSSDDPAGGRSVQVCQPPAAWCHTGVSSESGSAQGGSNSPSQTVRASGNESAGARSADGTQIGDMQGARSWGSPGSMQGVRPIVSAAPAATAWVSPTRQQGMPRPQEPGGSQPVSPRIGLGRTGGHTMGKNQDGEAAQSPEGPRVGTSLSGSSMIPGRSLSVSQDDFPFPGRREVTWGVINTSSQLSGGLIELADDHKTTAMENMHSGLGEPIVPPPVPGHPEFANLSKHQKAFGEDRYAQVQGVPNWGSGHLVEGGYVPGPMHAMYPGAWGQGWAPGPTGHMDAHKGVPTPGGGGAQYAKTPHPAVPNGLPWRVNAPLTSAAADGVLQSDSSTRGSVVNIPDDPWDIGDTEKPEPRVYGQGSPRSMPPVHSVPGRSQFSCPLTNKLMEDPVVAADGFTYERSSIEEWLVQNGKSPMTKQPLLHKELVPNLTMRAAIRLLGPGQK
ncbi:unnamed protein product [Ostreobium quekettii]|uniref:U-box domain-containing protein n=1 Tax=Ostreobium quekettii TaxID=121088 RepID=A0A8S1IZ36_9CHLO|nr:unnamed protein product [Ostreobium quekettii]